MSKYFLTDNVELKYVNRDLEKISEIENSINKIECKKGELKIDLSKYLNEIEGFVVIKRKERFFTSLNDLDSKFSGQAFVYTEKGLVSLDDEQFELIDFVENNSISFLEIPIIDSNLQDKYDSGMEFTEGDVNEVIERLEHEFDYVTILFKNEVQNEIRGRTIAPDDYIVRELTFEHLEKLGQHYECYTKSKLKHYNLYNGIDKSVYMLFEEEEGRSFYSRKNDALFIRNVLIDDFYFRFKNISSLFSVSRTKINILSNDFVPNISRNNLSEKSSENINYLVNKVIHLAALEHFEMEDLERECLKKFIDDHFGETI